MLIPIYLNTYPTSYAAEYNLNFTPVISKMMTVKPDSYDSKQLFVFPALKTFSSFVTIINLIFKTYA